MSRLTRMRRHPKKRAATSEGPTISPASVSPQAVPTWRQYVHSVERVAVDFGLDCFQKFGFSQGCLKAWRERDGRIARSCQRLRLRYSL